MKQKFLQQKKIENFASTARTEQQISGLLHDSEKKQDATKFI